MRLQRAFLLALLGVLWPAWTIQAAGFSVVPMLQEVTLDERTTTETVNVAVTNETDISATFELFVIDFSGLDESGGVAFLGATGELERKYALANWMQPEMANITLAPREERTVKLRIENRDDLSPGGHYGALIFKDVSPTPLEEPSVAISQLFSSLVFVKKIGGAQYGLELAAIGYERPWFSFDTDITSRFKNTGNVHVVPRGELRVTDPLGRLTYRGVLNEGSTLLLPESSRAYSTKLFLVEKAFVPGYYTLNFSYRYDGKVKSETHTERFFLIPKQGFMAFAAIISILTLSFWIRRRFF